MPIGIKEVLTVSLGRQRPAAPGQPPQERVVLGIGVQIPGHAPQGRQKGTPGRS